MDELFTDHPYYGARRMMHVLKTEGYEIGHKKVRRYYQILGIEAIYPKMNLSRRNQALKKSIVLILPNQTEAGIRIFSGYYRLVQPLCTKLDIIY